MRENFSGVLTHLKKQIAQALETPKTAEKVGSVETAQQSETPSEEQRERRIATIDAKRRDELTKLNAARARLGLPPSHTSVAVVALDRERIALNSMRNSAGFESALPVDREPGITPAIRAYFTEALGPQETIRRLRVGGPKFEDKVRKAIRDGNETETIWLMELIGRRLTAPPNHPTSLAQQDAAQVLHAMKTIDKIEDLKRKIANP